MNIAINLNADMAEGFGAYDVGDDAGILKIIGSANSAYGFMAAIRARRVMSCAKRTVAASRSVWKEQASNLVPLTGMSLG
jgi:lactam utilization protein B